MKQEFVRNPYNYDSDKLSQETGQANREPSRTQQQFAEEADINYIAERFMRTGEMPTVLHLPTQGDFEGIFDFQTAMNTIVKAKQEFMSLPAKVRSRFHNDPAELLAFVEDPDNRDEALKLGFIEKRDTIPNATLNPTKGADNEAGTQGSPDQIPQTKTGTGRTPPNAAKDAGTQKS